MADQLERELRRLVQAFIADVRDVVRQAALRSIQLAFNGVPERADHAATSASNDVSPTLRPPLRRTFTADQLATVRAQLTEIIQARPGQTTVELARAVGIPSNRLRPQLRQLAADGVIYIEAHSLGGPRRYTYRAAETPAGQHAEAPAVLVEAAA